MLRCVQWMKRLAKKGTENGKLSIDRLYDIGAHASNHCFPNVRQEHVTEDDMEETWGRGGWEEIRQHVPRLSVDRRSLARASYRPKSPTRQTKTSIRPPSEANPTMSAPAHSQQVGFEACLLASELADDGTFVDTKYIIRSWSTALVHTVGPEAKHLQAPTVLAHQASGQPFLVVLSLGRCLLGMPLRVLSTERRVLGLIVRKPP